MSGDQRAEVEQGGIHIGHAGKILGIDRRKKCLIKRALGAFQIGVVRPVVGEHDVDVGQIALGLKGV